MQTRNSATRSPDLPVQPYCGRFAPTPSGPLHLGSLVAALGSWLDARAAGGRWLLRIEDVDTPRVVRGSIDTIQRQLAGFGLCWDGEVLLQSRRFAAYAAALEQLHAAGWIYRCNCTRARIQASARQGPEGPVYPGHCRHGLSSTLDSSAWRMRTTSEPIVCHDRLLPPRQFDLQDELGDFVLQRADGIYAYQLAVVVDDAWQGVNQVVRGADLYLSTPRQAWLQQCLGLPSPTYMHLPLVLNAAGEKLSKQTLAPAILPQQAAPLLVLALQFLGQQPPEGLAELTVDDILLWAVRHWQTARIPCQGGQIQQTELG